MREKQILEHALDIWLKRYKRTKSYWVWKFYTSLRDIWLRDFARGEDYLH